MRIRKRTPARAASPGPPPPPSPPPLPLQQPTATEKSREEDRETEEAEKPAILTDRVLPAADSGNKNRNSATADDVLKPEPQEQDDAAAAARCSRNDGKRWRCKKAAVPGYLFCDRHIAWSTRKRKPRAKKPKSHGSGVLELEELDPTTTIPKFAEDHQRDAGSFGGF